MSCFRRAAALPLGALAVASLLAAGCEPKHSSQPARAPWSHDARYVGQAAAPVFANLGPEPYALPGGSEARDPWGARPLPVPAAVVADAGPFLILTSLQGSAPEQREPAVNALIARLGGVRRAPSLWEVAPQSGTGVAAVAAALESELCAEDVVVLYRARNQVLERSEFAGRRVCGPAAAPPTPTPRGSGPAKRPVVADPLHTRF